MKRYIRKNGVYEKRGSVLVFSLILLSIVLLSALSIMSTTIIGQNVASVTDNSTIAFQVADTGAEQAFHEFRKKRIKRLSNFSGAHCSNGIVTATNINGIPHTRYEILFRKEDGTRVTSCNADTKDIRSAHSTGYYLNAVRAVEVSISLPTDNVNDGLVAHWTFDTNMNDATSNHHDGAARNGAHITHSSSNVVVGSGALVLDGSNDYVVIPRSSDFNYSENDNYSISFWVRFNSASGWQAPLHKRFGYFLESDGVQWNYQGLTPSTSQFRITPGKWYHVVLWQSGSTGSRALYINGKRADQKASIRASRNKMIYFGAEDAGGSFLTKFFGGIIDDVRFYNRAITVEEIKILCENTFDGGNTPSGVTCGS